MLKRLTLLILCFTFAVTIPLKEALAQSNRVTTSTASGVMPYSLYGGARENINLATGNLNLQIPLLSVPGRAGLDLSVGLTYDSKNNYLTYTYNEYTGQVFYSTQTEQRAPYVGSTGWRVNAPVISSSARCEEGTIYAYDGDFVVTMPDGSRHHFENEDNTYARPYGCDNAYQQVPYPAGDAPLNDSNDGSFMRLDTSPSDHAILRMKDGTRIYFYGATFLPYGTGLTSAKVVDPNGNFIVYTYSGGAWPIAISSITDSLGRVVNFTYTSGKLSQITYKDSSGTQRSISFGSPAGI